MIIDEVIHPFKKKKTDQLHHIIPPHPIHHVTGQAVHGHPGQLPSHHRARTFQLLRGPPGEMREMWHGSLILWWFNGFLMGYTLW